MSIQSIFSLKKIYFLIFLSIGLTSFSQRILSIDSLKKIIQTSPSDTVVLSTIYQLGRQYMFDENNEKLELTANVLKNRIEQTIQQTKYKKTAEHYLPEIYNFRARAAWNRGEFNKALDLAFHAIKEEEKHKNLKARAFSYNQIGLIYFSTQKYMRSNEFLHKALNLRLQLKDSSGVGVCYNNLGLVANAQKKYSNALEFYQKALFFHERSVGTNYLASACNNIGETYQALGNKTLALKYCLKGLEIRKKSRNKSSLAYSYSNLGFLYLKQANYKLAKLMADSTLIMASPTNELPAMLEAYQIYYSSDSTTKNYQSAFQNFRKYEEIKDELFNSNSNKQIEELQIQFETKKKDAKIRMIRLQADSQKRNLIVSVVIIVLLIIVLLLGILSYQRTKRYNIYLQREEERKELLLQEVHHRTNNSLQLMSALIAMQNAKVTDEDVKYYLQQSESRIHSMSSLHALLNQNSIEQEVDMNRFLGEVLSFHQRLLPDHVKLTADVSSVQFPSNIALPIALIANELITNAIKYAFDAITPGVIIVHFWLPSPESWELVVSDNGIGAPNGTYSTKSGSIGSTIIQVLAKQLRAELVLDNVKGTKIVLKGTLNLT